MASVAIDGIRPEHFRLDGDGIDARVVLVEPMGSETQVIARLGARDVCCLFRERVAMAPGAAIRH